MIHDRKGHLNHQRHFRYNPKCDTSLDKTWLVSCFSKMLIESVVSVHITTLEHLIKEGMFSQNKESRLKLDCAL